MSWEIDGSVSLRSDPLQVVVPIRATEVFQLRTLAGILAWYLDGDPVPSGFTFDDLMTMPLNAVMECGGQQGQEHWEVHTSRYDESETDAEYETRIKAMEQAVLRLIQDQFNG